MTYPFKRTFTRVKGKKLINAKKVTIDGIEFDSSLEGFMYRKLKDARIPFTYEGKTFLLLDKFTYGVECYEKGTASGAVFKDSRATRKMEYTPDFIGENEDWIIETKGKANESFPLRWKIFKTIMNRRKNPPMLFKPTNQKECVEVIAILKSKGYGK